MLKFEQDSCCFLRRIPRREGRHAGEGRERNRNSAKPRLTPRLAPHTPRHRPHARRVGWRHAGRAREATGGGSAEEGTSEEGADPFLTWHGERESPKQIERGVSAASPKQEGLAARGERGGIQASHQRVGVPACGGPALPRE
jgi:hypothetical protein